MRRRVLTIGSAVSLLLCPATAVLWVGSYWRSDELDWRGEAWTGTESNLTEFELVTGRGYLRFACNRFHDYGPGYFPYNPEFDPLGWRYRRYDGPFNVWLNVDPKPLFAGFGGRWDSWDDKEKGEAGRSATLVIPCWSLTALFAFLPIAVTIPAIRRAIRRPTSCRSCGYNLAGNVSGVCPECGTQTRDN